MPADPVEKAHYSEGSWKGHPRFQCNHCPFDSLDRGITEAHVFERHLRPAAQQRMREQEALTRPAAAVLFDATGELVKRVAVTPPTLPKSEPAVVTSSPTPAVCENPRIPPDYATRLSDLDKKTKPDN